VWQRTDLPTHELAGGQETAARPARGVLGAAPAGRQALDRHLPEIAALLDPRQFDVITARDAGVIVIQGGAGSGKTTVGLHRLAHLAYNYPTGSAAADDGRDPRRRAGRVHRRAAASLGIEGVRVATFGRWQRELGIGSRLRAEITDEVAPVVTRVRATRPCCTSLHAGAPPTPASAPRAVVELGRPADRRRGTGPLRDPPRCRSPSATSSTRTESWSTGSPLSSPATRAANSEEREAKRRARRKKGRLLPSCPRHALDRDGTRAEGRPAHRDSDLPEGIRRVEGMPGEEQMTTRPTTRISARNRHRGHEPRRRRAAGRRRPGDLVATSQSYGVKKPFACSSTRRRTCRR
jgi:hypothetical protein